MVSIEEIQAIINNHNQEKGIYMSQQENTASTTQTTETGANTKAVNDAAKKSKTVCLTLDTQFAEFEAELELKYSKKFVALEEKHKIQCDEKEKQNKELTERCIKLETRIKMLEAKVSNPKIIWGDEEKCGSGS